MRQDRDETKADGESCVAENIARGSIVRAAVLGHDPGSFSTLREFVRLGLAALVN